MKGLCSSKWKSVRPIRFRSEIFGALDYIGKTGKVTISDLAKFILELRTRMEDKRLQALGIQKSLKTRTKDPNRQPYLTQTQQLVRVLRSTGFIVVNKEKLTCTELSSTILSKREKDGIEADGFFLEKLFNSRFHTYWLYAKQLDCLGKMTIPQRLSKRNKSLRDYIEQLGFPSSVWTFYIIRDLFYDFGLLNYIIEEKEEKIFPVYSLNKEQIGSYSYQIECPEGYIYYWNKINMVQFEEAMAQSYLKLVGGWDRIIEIISLREQVSEMLKISERQFNILLDRLVREPNKIRVYPSIGALSNEKRKGYMTKVLSLPVSDRGYPLTLVRLSEEAT